MGFWSNLFGGKPKLDHEQQVISPNGKVVVTVKLKLGQFTYSVKEDGKIILRESGLGINLQGEQPLKQGLMIVRIQNRKVDETWNNPIGEQRVIRNNYTETAFYLAETAQNGRMFTVRFRVFDDGTAFRYEIPPQPRFQRLIVSDELTEFNVDVNSNAWRIPAYQPDRYEYNYEKRPVYALASSVHTPLTIETPLGDYISIHEAALYNYGSMTLKLNSNNRLQSDITPLSDGMRAYIDLPFNTPWRVVMIADSPIELITNRIVLNLNDPPRQDFSWVKPIKFIGIWWAMFVGEWTWAPGERHGATTEHAKEYIDAAKRLGIEGLLMEGWNNGWEGDWLQNGASTDFLNPVSDLNLDEVANYARENGIKLIGHHETVGFIDNYERQMEEAYNFYAERGINYIKPGYAGSMMTIQGRKEFIIPKLASATTKKRSNLLQNTISVSMFMNQLRAPVSNAPGRIS